MDLHVTSFLNECLGIGVSFKATSGNLTEYNADLGFSIIHFIAYLIPSDEAYTFPLLLPTTTEPLTFSFLMLRPALHLKPTGFQRYQGTIRQPTSTRTRRRMTWLVTGKFFT